MLRHGNAKTLPLKSVESLDAALALAAAAPPSDGGGEHQKENDAAVANASAPSEKAAATATAAGTGKAAAPLMECEGGVCKLVRKPKKPAAAVATPPAEPAPGPAIPTAADAVDAAAATRTMECEGGVCKLVRKPKKAAAPEEQGQGTGPTEPAVAPAATVPAAAAPAPVPAPARTMECEGGVCKLVRKPKKEAPEQQKAKVPAVKAEKNAEEEESSLGVGDVMPSLQVIRINVQLSALKRWLARSPHCFCPHRFSFPPSLLFLG